MLFSTRGIVSELVNPEQVRRCFWEVYIEEDRAYLRLLRSNKQMIYQFKDSPFKDWYALSSQKTFSVKAIPITTNSAMSATMQKLTGTWTSTIYPSDLIEDLTEKRGKSVQSANFRYHIRPNGTFQKSIYMNAVIHQEVEGVWQISSDGKYFILHFDKGDDVFQTYIAAIKHLSFDELVLDQALITSDLELRLCSEMDTFFFNRT